MAQHCVVCGASSLQPVTKFARLRRVTSDCRPFDSGGELGQCARCGAVQKPDTLRWRADCARIYAAYDSYGLSGGAEQAVRSGDGSAFAPRSEIVLRRYRASVAAPARGRILDFGCGKGPTSLAASRVLSGWTIDGFDQDDRALPVLSTIPGFDRLYTDDPAGLPSGRYDLIVLMHALEHVPTPIDMLALLAGKLAPGGHILIEVPDREANPYDLLVADHLLHFDRQALRTVGAKAGLVPVSVSQRWVAKELSMLLACQGVAESPEPAPDLLDASRQVDWLFAVADICREAARNRPLCIFGSSIVGTWIASELPTSPDCYIDEDPGKTGRSLDGVPIVAPRDAPAGATVILAVAPAVAATIAARLAPLGFAFVTVPTYPQS
ncbi:MAG: class I SAM-dependent methyltransferase [Alphaproteobacteria bacterium]|nr:class I SAM-dependent methyltransferase [Alphaproteobacteria bacterium]MCW5743809.1 class I SAM-dependent methyltransferase [Alphaproteobacteria bacterium]